MIYSTTGPYLAGAIDSYVTGGYDEPDEAYCSNCGKNITAGDSCYYVNEEYYCMRCKEVAKDAILDMVESEYIFEME